jgi:hypothetical protein
MSEIGITWRLDNALNKLVRAKNPSIEEILRSHGYQYEAKLIRQILRAYERES